jgi:ATP-dependent DNA helicase RecG
LKEKYALKQNNPNFKTLSDEQLLSDLELSENEKLSVLEIIALTMIKKHTPKKDLDSEIVNRLLDKKLIEKRGKTNAVFYILSKDYYEFTDEKAKYYNLQELDENQVLTTVLQFLFKEERAKMKDFVGLFEDKLSRKQVRFRIEKFVTNDVLEQQGEGSTSIYKINDEYVKQMEVYVEAISKTLSDLESKNERAKKGPRKDN